MTATAKDILVKARSLIVNPEHWTKGTFFRVNAGGEDCFCALGAMDKAFWATRPNRIRVWRDSLDLLVSMTPGQAVAVYNDLPETTHADILALFDKAIEAATETVDQ